MTDDTAHAQPTLERLPAGRAEKAPTEHPAETARFIERLQRSLSDGSFMRLALGRPQGGDATLEKLLARRVALRGGEQLSLVWRHRTRDITKNLPFADAVALIGSLIGAPFLHAHLVTCSHDVQLLRDRKGRWALRAGRLPDAATPPPNAAEAAAHDRTRRHALTLDTPFLAELGVADAQHRLVPAMARKWRQINKFVEVLGHALAESPLAARDAAQPVRVLDFGAGKGYLTFAVHHWLHAAGRRPEVTGVELREDLVALCNEAAARLHLNGLRFVAGDVRHFRSSPEAQGPGEPAAHGGAARAPQLAPNDGEAALDIMIALHACDVATDIALHHGLREHAAIIVCSPCCHKELRPQMRAPALLQPMLRHGIHMTEQAEMLTDSLRALLLQAEGYDTQVFEFVSPEHTAKNKMLLAVRRRQALPAAQRQALLDQVAALKAYYGVRTQCLEQLLAGAPVPEAACGLDAAEPSPA